MSQNNDNQALNMQNFIETAELENHNDEMIVDSSNNILVHLNNDCLIQVFEYLELRDLCNVADVCRAFESVALQIFKRRHSVIDLHDTDTDYESEYKGNQNIYEIRSSDSDVAWNSKHDRNKPVKARHGTRCFDMETAKRLFRHFGDHIKSIALIASDDDKMKEILNLMAIHCIQQDAVLTKLIMIDVEIARDLIPRMKPLFDRLMFLDVFGCEIYPFWIGVELTELTLECIHLYEAFTQKLEKLHTVSLTDVEGNSSGIFESLLKMTTHLKRLRIMGRLRKQKWSLASLPSELEELEVDLIGEHENIEEEFMNLTQLRMLKVLRLNCMGLSMTYLFKHLVEQKVPIEELCLKDFTLTANDVTSLAGLSKMKKLSLIKGGWAHGVRLSDVIEGTSDLEQLHLNGFGCVTIDIIKSTIEKAPKLKNLAVNLQQNIGIAIGRATYTEICRLIRKRSDVLKLSLELRGDEIKMNVPEYILEANRLWLEVTIITVTNVQPVNIVDYDGLSDSESSSSESSSSESSESSSSESSESSSSESSESSSSESSSSESSSSESSSSESSSSEPSSSESSSSESSSSESSSSDSSASESF